MISKLAALFRTKPVSELASEDTGEGPKLNKVLTAWDVFFHGVAAIIGTGIFVLTGVAAAEHAGPAIILSFVIAGLACTFVSFNYSELASMIPKSGSAYTYAYATLGELVAWFIGWDLLLEYCVGASAVAVGWSAYMQNLLKSLGFTLPAIFQHAPASMPWQHIGVALAFASIGGCAIYIARQFYETTRARIIGCAPGAFLVAAGAVYLVSAGVDILAIAIIGFLNYWLIKGVKHTARMTAVFVVIKIAVIALFITIGVWHINPTNYTPFMPFGWQGVITGAAVVFFAYIGFDAVSTLAEECKDPKRDMSRGIIGSLVVCAVLYIVVAAIMTGAVPYTLLGGTESAAPMATVMNHIGAFWATPFVSIGAIAGITSVLIVLLFGQSRIMMSMSRDGLMSPFFSKIHPKYQTPVGSIIVWGLAAAFTSGFVPINELAELTSIGTLAAFILVCVGVLVLRRTEPNRERKFRCPNFPFMIPAGRLAIRVLHLPPSSMRYLEATASSLMPILGALFSLGLMCSLPMVTWLRFVGWLAIGMVIYFCYGRQHSVLGRRAQRAEAEKQS